MSDDALRVALVTTALWAHRLGCHDNGLSYQDCYHGQCVENRVVLASSRPEPLDVDRLARAFTGGYLGLDEHEEWWATPRVMAETIAAEYDRLGDKG